jgi:hypothetical protein
VVVRRGNLELGENGKGHEGLDWFRPPESKTLFSVVELGVNGEIPSNGALGRLIWPAG